MYVQEWKGMVMIRLHIIYLSIPDPMAALFTRTSTGQENLDRNSVTKFLTSTKIILDIHVPRFTCLKREEYSDLNFFLKFKFLWFWFGLEILRSVYKDQFFKCWTVSVCFNINSEQKVAPSLLRVEKISLKKLSKGYPKFHNFVMN